MSVSRRREKRKQHSVWYSSVVSLRLTAVLNERVGTIGSQFKDILSALLGMDFSIERAALSQRCKCRFGCLSPI